MEGGDIFDVDGIVMQAGSSSSDKSENNAVAEAVGNPEVLIGESDATVEMELKVFIAFLLMDNVSIIDGGFILCLLSIKQCKMS